MGGLVTQRAILDLPPEDRVRLIHGVAFFGTPSLGLRKAQFGRIINRQIRDLGQESPFISTLRQNWSEEFKDGFSFNLLTVAGDLDEFVPAESALTPFAAEYQKITAGNHLDIVKPTDADHLSFQILKNFLQDNHYDAPANGAAVAVELGQFQKAILALEPVKDDLDARGQVNYALALVGIGKEDEAIAYLSNSTKTSNTDVMGTLGGRYKRRWLVSSTESDAQKALDLYQKAYTIASAPATFKPEQVYYHAINLAFFALLYQDDLAQAQSYAKIAIEHCEHPLSTDHLWKWATLGEAYLYLQDGDQAFDYYKKALEAEPLPSQRNAMYLHWHPLTQRMGLREVEGKLELLFHSFG
jgi:tetratricopeptide (TPR) repeat protein